MFRSGAILGLLLLLSSETFAAVPPDLARCGSAKLEAIAQACSDLLGIEARFRNRGNEGERERRREGVRRRVVAAWAEAESFAGDATCAERTARGPDAVDALAALAEEVLAEVTPPRCAARLGRLARRHCRRLVNVEALALVSAQKADEARTRVVAQARRRLSLRWPGQGCSPGAEPDDALRRVLTLAGGAAAQASPRGLRELGDAVGVPVGVSIEPFEVAADPDYLPTLRRETGSLTAENAMKWAPIHPAPGQWNFGPADAVMDLAEEEGMRVRGHALVWGALSVPAYVEAASGPEQLRAYLAEHITGVVDRYAGRIAQWDVVNEPLSAILDPPTSDGLDDNVFQRLLGTAYIAEAFHLARAADPTVRLFLNENGIAAPGPRQDLFYDLVVDLLVQGVPIDGIGFQGHVGLTPLAVYPDRATWEASLRRFADLGLDVEITELDVSVLFRFGSSRPPLRAQADDYRAAFGACLRVPRCRGVTTWGISDRYTWVRSFLGLPDDPLPFDDGWIPKPAYFAMRGSLYERLYTGP